MPIYEYRCNDCGKEFEYQQRMSDDPKSVCESCGGALEKLISRSSFHLKGSGWYKDLYSSPKKDAAKGESTSSDAKSDGGGSSDSSAKSSDSGSSASSGSSSSSDSSSAT